MVNSLMETVHRYQPYGTAIELFNSRESEILVSGIRACLTFLLTHVMLVNMKTCEGPQCDKTDLQALGLCTGHYQQKRRGQVPLTPLLEKTRSDTRDQWGRKRCAGCKEWLPIEEFWSISSAKVRDGLNSSCKSCERNRMIERRYNITAKRYDELLESQDGVCAICQRDPGENNLAVDHDHNCCPDKKKSCGYCVRGLLCSDCNGAIGMLQESPRIFARALNYLGGDA